MKPHHCLKNLFVSFALAVGARAEIFFPTTVDAGAVPSGLHTSIALVQGSPAISYYEAGSGDLKFAVNSASDGTGAWTVLTVANAADVGQYTSLAVVNGHPAISYYDVTNGDLKYVRASDAGGSAWSTPPFSVDSAGDVGKFTSLKIINGHPAISYYDETRGDLKYVRASEPSGHAWGDPIAVDGDGDVGRYASLAAVGGYPAISYFDNTGDNLKFVRGADVNGGEWLGSSTLDSTGLVGFYTSLAIVASNPAIAYWDASNTGVKFIRATDTAGANWNAPITVDTAGAVGQFASLAVVNGNPAISYQDILAGDLKFVRASNATGSAWGLPNIVDSIGDVGEYTALAIVAGRPAIAYHDATRGDLKFVRAANTTGSGAWGTPAILHSTGDVGEQTSQAIVNGNPAISYLDSSNGDLKFARNSAPNGFGTWTIITVVSADNVGFNPSLALVSGNPAIAYYDKTNGDLKYVRATDASGTAWGQPVTADSTGDLGQFASLAIVNGNPAISYYDFTNFDLKYVRSTDPTGSAWGTPATVDGGADVGQSTSLAIVNGNPAISYHDNGNGDLKYVRATSVNGSTWGAPVIAAGVGNVGGETSLAIVNGNPAIAYQGVGLQFARAADVNGISWSSVVVDNGNLGGYLWLAIINGNPAISYYEETSSALKYVRATNASGTAWGTPNTVDNAGAIGEYNSLALLANGSPAICYYDRTNGDLKWAGSFQAAEIAVEQPAGTNLIDGSSSVAFETAVNSATVPKTCTIKNVGASKLTLSAPVLVGGNAGNFQVNTSSMALALNSGQQTTFTVIFGTAVGGDFSTTLRIASDDPDENPFDITLTGTGLRFDVDKDGDGLSDAVELALAALGFDWEVSQPALVDTFYESAPEAGLFTPAEIQAANSDVPLLVRAAGGSQFTLTLGPEKSTNLVANSFQPFPFTSAGTTINGQGRIEFQFTTPEGAAFFRVQAP